MKFMSANRIAPDGTPRFALSHLGLFCLPMSHKKDARLVWVNTVDAIILVLVVICYCLFCVKSNLFALIIDVAMHDLVHNVETYRGCNIF